MSPRLIVFGSALLFVALAAPAAAQDAAMPKVAPVESAALAAQPTPTALTPAQLDRLRADVGTFEIVLQRAVNHAGQEMAQWAEHIVPNVTLVPAAEPVVRGMPIPDASITFHVEVAEMLGVNLWQVMQARQRPPQSDVGSRSVAQVVPGDPMAGAAAPRVTTADANAKYSELVRESIISAMLDSSGVLTLKDDQMLSVAVTTVDVAVTNPLYHSTSRMLILSIKGADLAALRQGKIARAEAERRITETRF